MKVEFIPKEKEPEITFNDLANGDVFKFTGEESTGHFWMKIGNSAIKVSNTKEMIPVREYVIVEYFESHIVIKGH